MHDEYHKIDSIFCRDQRGRILEGEYARPEFSYLADLKWLWTEKVDGTNVRLCLGDGTGPGRHIARVAGRTDRAQMPLRLVDHLTDLMARIPLAEVFPGQDDVTPVTLYGEGYGAGIQRGGGKYLPDGCGFVLFDVRVGQWWLRRPDVEDVATKLDLDVVPVLSTGTLREAVELARVGFPSQRWPGVEVAEGIVLRPEVELFDRGGRRVITKIKHRDFETKAAR